MVKVVGKSTWGMQALWMQRSVGRLRLSVFQLRTNSTTLVSLHGAAVLPVAAVHFTGSTPRHFTTGRGLNATTTAVEGSATAASDLLETSSQSQWALDAALDLPSSAAVAAAALPEQGDFTSLGLGGYSPVGLIQWSFEFLHSSAHLPWWLAIVFSTIILRTAMLPVAVSVQRNAARLNNIRPETEKLMAKVKQYNQAGNSEMSSQQNAKLYALYQKHNCNPFKMLIMPLVQLPVFVSFFVSIRQMATVPVESMKTGGLFWFTDLTLADPLYIMPVLSCASFMATIELGGEAGVSNPQTEKLKTFFRCLAIMLIPITSTFPAGLFMYWLPASVLSMAQILVLRVPSVRAWMGIPQIIKHPTESSSQQGGGFLKTIKENYRNSVLVDQAKKSKASAKKRYDTLRKDASPTLFDQPPHLRKKQ